MSDSNEHISETSSDGSEVESSSEPEDYNLDISNDDDIDEIRNTVRSIRRSGREIESKFPKGSLNTLTSENKLVKGFRKSLNSTKTPKVFTSKLEVTQHSTSPDEKLNIEIESFCRLYMKILNIRSKKGTYFLFLKIQLILAITYTPKNPLVVTYFHIIL